MKLDSKKNILAAIEKMDAEIEKYRAEKTKHIATGALYDRFAKLEQYTMGCRDTLVRVITETPII